MIPINMLPGATVPTAYPLLYPVFPALNISEIISKNNGNVTI